MLQKNDPADFIIIDNFNDFNILKTYINGEMVAENGKSLLPKISVDTVNNFVAEKVNAHDFKVEDKGKDINIIGVIKSFLFKLYHLAGELLICHRFKRSASAAYKQHAHCSLMQNLNVFHL